MSRIVLSFFAVFCSFACVQCANILLVPFTDGSHILQMDGLGTPMVNRGHKVYVLLQVGFKMPRNTDSRYEVVYFGKEKSADQVTELTKHNSAGGSTTVMFQTIVDSTCIEMATDNTMWQRLTELQIDLVVVDNFDFACYFLVPFKLGVPFVTMSSTVSMWHNRMPVLPSVTNYIVGIDKIGPSWCSQLDSLPLLIKRFCQLRIHYFNDHLHTDYETDMHAYLEYPPMSVLRSNASLALINNSPLLGALYPKTPNVEFVGGVTTKPAVRLPEDLQAWMDVANDVVVVSFGSRFTRLANSGNEKLLEAFAKLPFRFLVRFKTAEYRDVQLPANVKIVDWLPQNDVLGHKHTRLMIAHCGLNGLFEALYHAVPVMCLYVDADQPANSRKIEALGYGFGRRASEFESRWIVETVKEMCSNSSYRRRIQTASRVFLSEKHPSERAADALEHVLRFGAQHLKPHEALELTWWQFYMLDVVAVVYTLLLVLVYAAYKVLSLFVLGVRRFIF